MGATMNHVNCNVLQQHKRLTETDCREMVSDLVRRLVKAHGRERVALEAGCDVRTIDSALAGNHTPKPHTLFNLLALDLAALDGVMARFGGHVVPVEASNGPGMELLADTAKLVAIHGAALSDGHIDHRERAELIEASKPVVQGWAAVGARQAVA